MLKLIQMIEPPLFSLVQPVSSIILATAIELSARKMKQTLYADDDNDDDNNNRLKVIFFCWWWWGQRWRILVYPSSSPSPSSSSSLSLSLLMMQLLRREAKRGIQMTYNMLLLQREERNTDGVQYTASLLNSWNFIISTALNKIPRQQSIHCTCSQHVSNFWMDLERVRKEINTMVKKLNCSLSGNCMRM